jgi:hypothetical protein
MAISVMPLYRIYWIGGDGHIKAAENVECASHEEAQTKALKVIGSYPAVEVWLGANRIARVCQPN